MKKNNLIIAALAATSILSFVPLHAMQKERMGKAISTAKEKATKQFDESLDRFKRCIQLQCTKGETLKASRDVSIAVAALIAAAYGAGTALKEGAEFAEKRKGPPGYSPFGRPGKAKPYAYELGEALTAPVAKPISAIKRIPFEQFKRRWPKESKIQRLDPDTNTMETYIIESHTPGKNPMISIRKEGEEERRFTIKLLINPEDPREQVTRIK